MKEIKDLTVTFNSFIPLSDRLAEARRRAKLNGISLDMIKEFWVYHFKVIVLYSDAKKNPQPKLATGNK